MVVEQGGNVVLGALLAELGWSPGRLAEAVNGLLGPGYVGRSTVSEWVHRDRVPRHPLPTVVAHLVSDVLDREVSVEWLWSGRARPAELWVPADVDLGLPWTAAGTVGVLDDWLRHTGGSMGVDRRTFLAVGGAALTGPAWGYVDHLVGRGGSFTALAAGQGTMTVTPATVDVVAAMTAGIRNLGGVEGGHEDNLRIVHRHLTWVGKLLRQSRFSSNAVADRLLAEWAQLAQFAGWMAHDTGKHGLSQRCFISGLHAAHTAGDRSVAAYLLVCMSQAAVSRGEFDDAIGLGRAARDAVELANAAHEAARSAPAVVRALAASRFAQAQAAAGNARGFHAAADEARALLDTPGALDALPSYLSWFDPDALEGQLADSGLILAGVTSRDSRSLLDGAEVVLGRHATDPASSPVSAVFYGAYLARAHVAAGDLERAVPAGHAALRRATTVRSRRCALLLNKLEADLAALPPTRLPASARSLQDQLRAVRAA